MVDLDGHLDSFRV